MINKLFTILKFSVIQAITISMAQVVPVPTLATEYVFSAPPEVDNNVVEEIPTQEADYPLYECEQASETEAETDEDNNTKIDSHNCECIDCEEVSQEEEQTKLSSRNQDKK